MDGEGKERKDGWMDGWIDGFVGSPLFVPAGATSSTGFAEDADEPSIVVDDAKEDDDAGAIVCSLTPAFNTSVATTHTHQL